uniref:Fibril-forming collagen alpha chain-like n=1 Tax=Callorhinchus milii TaxID=7868 RepID=A0A4W3GW15_CALMI
MWAATFPVYKSPAHSPPFLSQSTRSPVSDTLGAHMSRRGEGKGVGKGKPPGSSGVNPSQAPPQEMARTQGAANIRKRGNRNNARNSAGQQGTSEDGNSGGAGNEEVVVKSKAGIKEIGPTGKAGIKEIGPTGKAGNEEIGPTGKAGNRNIVAKGKAGNEVVAKGKAGKVDRSGEGEDRDTNLCQRLREVVDGLKIRKEERSEAANCVNEVVSKLLEHIRGKPNSCFHNIRKIPSGSYYESVKISRPNEFDMMVGLKVERTRLTAVDADGAYYTVQLKRVVGSHPLTQFVVGDILSAPAMLQHLRTLILQASRAITGQPPPRSS